MKDKEIMEAFEQHINNGSSREAIDFADGEEFRSEAESFYDGYQSALNQDRWVSVKDIAPDDLPQCSVMVRDGNHILGYKLLWIESSTGVVSVSIHIVDKNGDGKHIPITHFMLIDLPTPPKQEGE